MKKITITLLDESKNRLLKELLENFDFIEYEEAEQRKKNADAFEKSFGMWKNSEITHDIIRTRAWQRSA